MTLSFPPRPKEEPFFFFSSEASPLHLEGKISRQDTEKIVVICHPHPLHGGTMDNKVVDTLVRAFSAVGFSTLRFNFRGVGRSEGGYGHGIEEVYDLKGAVEALQAEMGAKACFAAGFSFGTTVIAEYLVQGGELEGALLVAPPLSMKQMPVFALPRRGMSMFLGEKDEFCDPASLAAYAQSFSVAVPFTILPAAEHYFHGHLPALAARIQEVLLHTLD